MACQLQHVRSVSRGGVYRGCVEQTPALRYCDPGEHAYNRHDEEELEKREGRPVVLRLVRMMRVTAASHALYTTYATYAVRAGHVIRAVHATV